MLDLATAGYPNRNSVTRQAAKDTREAEKSPQRIRGEAEALIFTKVDRASRCTEDFATLIRLSDEQGWWLIVSEMGIDTRSDDLRTAAGVMIVHNRERRRIAGLSGSALCQPGT